MLLCSDLLALLVGCDSSADNGGPPLTESESENLVLGMLKVMADDTALEDVEIGFDDLELELSLEWTTSCENGGEVQMAGKIVNFEMKSHPVSGRTLSFVLSRCPAGLGP